MRSVAAKTTRTACRSSASAATPQSETGTRRTSGGWGSRTIAGSRGAPSARCPRTTWWPRPKLAYVVRDAFPAAHLHTLVIPKRHVSCYFELGRAELNACHRLLEQEKGAIERADASVEGFNVGVNDGGVAGQTVFHCHIHLIPRRRGDVVDPTGALGTSYQARARTGDEPVRKDDQVRRTGGFVRGPVGLLPGSFSRKGVTVEDAAETTVLVTGATDGLGRRVARGLAAKGAAVLLHGRSPERLEAALEEVRSHTGSEKLGSYLADLSSLSEVRGVA